MSDAPASMSERLRKATFLAHQQTEAALDLFGPGLSPDRYATLLERWLGFEKTWERVSMAALYDTVPEFFLEARLKRPMLEADLLHLGRSEAAIDALPRVPDDALPWHTAPGALGVLYVAEGSTLGGQYVARKLATRLGLTPEHGLAYFTSYGPEVGPMWRQTKALLDSVPPDDRTIDAANAAFEFLGAWLSTGKAAG